ncbi:MAG: protein jag [Clostridia bacterium]|nr:protein jag [Clostridia bacterium]
MLKDLIKEADTVEAAVELAAVELNVSVEELEVEVLQEPQKKAFGLFGGTPAKVKVTVKGGSPAEAAVAFLKKVLATMGVTQVEITVKEENNHCTLSLEGEDLGFIIGRRGETLDALQYLTSLVANRVENAYYRVSLDIGNYREKREGTLTSLARRHANQAAKNGRKTSLEPMNPYERRIIHTAVQQVEGATSWSVGSEPNRHVIIGPSDDNPVKERAPRRNDRRRGERRERGRRNENGEYVIERPVREVRQFVPRSNPTGDAADFAPPERTLSEKENSATLYGRIDL